MKNKEGNTKLIIASILIICILCFSLVSASWFSNFIGKITGNPIVYKSKLASKTSTPSTNPPAKICLTGRAKPEYYASFKWK